MTENAALLRSLIGNHTCNDIVFACVGTDRSTGDCLGPLVGSKLKELGYDVRGTLNEPMHALNIKEHLDSIPQDKFVVGIDACLGKASSIGKVSVNDKPLTPGAGVNKELPPVGNINVHGVVNVGGFMEYFVLQNTRLSLVVRMVDEIVAMIRQVIPLNQEWLEWAE